MVMSGMERVKSTSGYNTKGGRMQLLGSREGVPCDARKVHLYQRYPHAVQCH